MAGRQELVHFLRESIIGARIGSLLSSWLVSGFSVRGRIRGAEWVGPVTRSSTTTGLVRYGAGWACAGPSLAAPGRQGHWVGATSSVPATPP